jgi:hypothetical protein
MVEMKMIGQDIGVIDLPFRVLGAPLGKSTTVIRLSSGEVLVHSAGPLREHNLAAIRELGEVKWLMEGSRLHDTFALRLRAAFPEAQYLLPAGFPLSAEQLAPAAALSDVPWEWGDEIKVIPVEGMPRLAEHALIHRPSRTLVLTDLVFNLAWEPGEKIPFFLRWISGFRSFPGTSRLVKLGVKDKAAVRQSLERIMAEEFEQVVVGHGLLMRDRAKERLREVLAWSLGQG